MNVLLRPVVRILISLVLFAGFALLLNDVEKFFTVSGEFFWFLMASPVFWGLFSVCCFVQLWWFNRKYPEESKDPIEPEEQDGYLLEYLRFRADVEELPGSRRFNSFEIHTPYLSIW